MLQEPPPAPQPDDDEPYGSVPAEDSADDDFQGPQQGLFVCLPPEELSLAGFAQDGRADTMLPGPLLGTVMHAVIGEGGSGLPGLSDDQLIGVLSGGRRMEAWSSWVRLAAMRELARRRPAVEPGDPGRAGFSDFAADEVMAEFHLTWDAAAGQIAYACRVADRLPLTFAALERGQIDPFAVKIIEDETAFLNAEDVAKADAILAELAKSRSFARLRYAAHRLVLSLDPDVAQRRKDEARTYAHVRRFREDSGNAGMVAHEMPPDEVLASWQHVEQRALDLRAAGLEGSLQELRVRAYLDLLQERDSRDAHGRSDAPEPPASSPGPTTGGTRRQSEPSVALVTITVPLETMQRRSDQPGEAGGFGLLDAEDARDLIAAAARHPRTRWCVTAVGPDGTAAAHGCATGRHPPPGLVNITMIPVARGPCDHARAEPGYQPSRKLAHRIRARSVRCSAPGCGRPAARCDLDHTDPWDQGGLTCECNLAPLCKR